MFGAPSIYTSIPRPKCGARLTRRRDLQFFGLSLFMLLLLGAIDTIVLFFHLSVMVFAVSAVLLVVLVIWPIDALTVRLVQPGKWRGCWRGYETNQTLQPTPSRLVSSGSMITILPHSAKPAPSLGAAEL